MSESKKSFEFDLEQLKKCTFLILFFLILSILPLENLISITYFLCIFWFLINITDEGSDLS